MGTKCPKCHFDHPADYNFCIMCGTKLFIPDDTSVPSTGIPQAPKQELTTGSTFAGRYQIIEELGKGSIGKVYRVLDKELQEEVILKLLKPEIALDKKALERFSNELKLARKIIHKNVGRMYELMEERGICFITMEYVPGEDLGSMIRMSGQLSVATAINIAKQVCEGLAGAHRLGVVHHNLKPNNIMIDKEGNVRIMDLGIASSLSAAGIKDEGVMIGTPEYMSPEQKGKREADHLSDIYSLGVILYEMVTGQVASNGDSPLSIAVKRISEELKDSQELNTQIPEDLSRVILRCIEKDKEKRYQGAEELLSELNKIRTRKPEAEKTKEIKWKNSIAVLPFADLSPQRDQEYFCDGLAEELINSFTKIKELRVVARTSVFSFKDAKLDIREIGKKLNVEMVLEGSVRKAGNKLRITAQLINATDGYHLWSERYDREVDDVFAIQDDITLAMVDKLKVKVLGEDKVKLVKRHTSDLEAYNLYLKGQFFWNKRTEEGMKRAIEYFRQAIEKDPEYTLAYIGLADSYHILPYYSSFPPKEAYAKAKPAAEKALMIDDTLAEAHSSLAMIIMMYDLDWESAEKEFKRAIDLNPNYSTAQLWYAWFLMFRARFDEAVEVLKRAQELDPLSLVINNGLGQAFYFARKYNRAIKQHRKTLEIDPNFIYTHLYLGLVYFQKSMYKEALAEIQNEKELSKGWNPHVETLIGISYLQMGKRREAQEVLDKLKKKSKKSYISPYHIALLYFSLGENDQGFKWIDKAYKERDYWLCWLKIDPLLDSIRSDPRFAELLKKVGLELGKEE